MKKLLVSWVVIVVMFVVGASFVRAGADHKFTKVYSNSKGDITFNHSRHSEVAGGCANCHDQLKALGGEVNKKFGHFVCKSCHKEVLRLAPNAPVSCTGCHVR
jgi:predicted CXXCH cytochrome family protein